ncbi:MAG: hypothetical protein FMNOHCHN_00825 [Ignavibacteriaceae bacterium]|nr:hypothetical protein [Ignavibacteriaceae bacterium]
MVTIKNYFMKTRLITIGNSKGIRIPKSFIEEGKLTGEVEIELRPDGIFIKPVKKVRENWDDAFKKMAVAGDDKLIDAENLKNQSSWDEEGWEW